jgi:hypothetical protein
MGMVEPTFSDILLQFAYRLQDHYLWLLGILLMIEPMLEYHVKSYRERADKLLSGDTRRRIAWALSFMCVFVACFLAFRDEYNSKLNVVSSLGSVTKERDKALGESVDALKQLRDAQNELATAKNDAVTAKNNLEQLKRIEDSHKDRSSLIKRLQTIYATASSIQVTIKLLTVTDAQIDQAEIDANKWLNDSSVWIESNMGKAAVAKFQNNSDKLSYNWNISGQHDSNRVSTRNNIINALAGCMTNLETLMHSDQWDPQ